MGRRLAQGIDDPYEPKDGDRVGRVLETKGSFIFTVQVCEGETVEAALPNRFKNAVWIRRGSYVVLSQAEITNVLTRDDIKQLKKNGKWPDYFNNTDSNKMMSQTGSQGDEDPESDADDCE